MNIIKSFLNLTFLKNLIIYLFIMNKKQVRDIKYLILINFIIQFDVKIQLYKFDKNCLTSK